MPEGEAKRALVVWQAPGHTDAYAPHRRNSESSPPHEISYETARTLLYAASQVQESALSIHILSAAARALLGASVLSATQFGGVSGRHRVHGALRLSNDQADASGAMVTRSVQETPHTARSCDRGSERPVVSDLSSQGDDFRCGEPAPGPSRKGHSDGLEMPAAV
jgi:hypothetical protein